jgi:hypothetical protein
VWLWTRPDVPGSTVGAVYSGYSRTMQIVSELQILWSVRHDEPVPKLTVRASWSKGSVQQGSAATASIYTGLSRLVIQALSCLNDLR